MATKLTLNLRTVKKDVNAILHGSFTLNKIADKQIIPRATLVTRQIVQQTFEAAVENIKEVTKRGVGDSDSPMAHMGIATGGGGTAGLTLRPAWQPLSMDYSRRKLKENRGAGVFHRYTGKMHRSFAGLKAPLVTATHAITKEASPGKGRKREIGFRVAVGAESMSFPLDELVRRPLLLGRKGLTDPSTVAGSGTEGQMRLLGLESGILRTTALGTANDQPARPFLGAMAVKLNSRMRNRILQQDSKE